MAAVRALPALAAALLLAAAGQASKYSREANEGLAAADGKRREAGEFRVVRLNQIWEKAQRVSGTARGDGAAGSGLRGRARPLQTLIPRQGDGRSGHLCVGEAEAVWPRLGAAVAFVLLSGMAVPTSCAQPRGGERPPPAQGRVPEPCEVSACPV